MPLYEYQCASCQKVHEIMQKFSDAPMTECPECGGVVSKLVSRSSFALKGTGWYTTDYKRKPAPAPVNSSASSAATASSTASTSASSPAASTPAAATPAAASTPSTSSGSGSSDKK